MKLKRCAIYPGTFDPVTYGHLDVLKRATALFDEVIVAVSLQSSKSTLFSLEERVELLKKGISEQTLACPVRVESFSGLLVRYAREKNAKALIRGLRAISDFDYEYQMALMNRHQDGDIESVFFMPDEKFVYLSSSMVREIARLNGDLSAFLPKAAQRALQKKFNP